MSDELFQIRHDHKTIELGGGANPMFRPNVDVRWCQNQHGEATVDFTADFDQDLPISSNEWDRVFCRYVLEHLSWRNVRKFLKEVHRILKSGGIAVFITPNTFAQMNWIRDNPGGWDGNDLFESASCVLFGDQDYPENTHKCYLDEIVIKHLLAYAGFDFVDVRPYGERKTDMIVAAAKGEHKEPAPLAGFQPKGAVVTQAVANLSTLAHASQSPAKEPPPEMPRKEMFDKHYFNGGGKVGGYAREGYWDYPIHDITAQHILNKAPGSVLELGAARGYLVKRFQDLGLHARGIEISRHCWLTRVCDGIREWDVCDIPWPFATKEFDLCFSMAFLEHVPEKYLDDVIREMVRVSNRCLHGIDFGEHDDGFDKTHCTLHDKDWWQNKFDAIVPREYKAMFTDKETLERGHMPEHVIRGDGKAKVNCGSFTTMYHHGWVNLDAVDLRGFAQAYGYSFVHHDLRNGLPFGTGTVHAIHASHFLEHLSYPDGVKFLKECRRVIRPDGAMRIAVPDAGILLDYYRMDQGLDLFDEINDGCQKAKTQVGKLHALLYEGHLATYDADTLYQSLAEAGWSPKPARFRTTGTDHPIAEQILRETLDMFPCLSLYMDAVPLLR